VCAELAVNKQQREQVGARGTKKQPAGADLELVGEGQVGHEVHAVFEEVLVLDVLAHGEDELAQVAQLGQEQRGGFVVTDLAQQARGLGQELLGVVFGGVMSSFFLV
jgi:hypothetical protein